MYFDYHYPASSNIGVIFAVFAASLLIFHFTLVRRRLGKVGWKRVDYWWLGLAAIALITEAQKAREMVIPNFKSIAGENRLAAYADLKRSVRVYSEMPCSEYIRGDFSPGSIEQLKKTAAKVCEWTRLVEDALPPRMESAITPEMIPAPPETGSFPDVRITVIQQGVKNFNDYVAKYNEVLERGRDSPVEETLKILSPFLLAVALALRITKVRGEIKVEQAAAQEAAAKTPAASGD